jgi:hypothetical protein
VVPGAVVIDPVGCQRVVGVSAQRAGVANFGPGATGVDATVVGISCGDGVAGEHA